MPAKSDTPAATNVAELPVAKTRRAPAKPAPAADATPPVAVVSPGPAPLKKKDFLIRATEAAGIRKSDARTAIEATLATLAAALAEGREVILPPLGKIKVVKEKETRNGKQMVLRLVPPRPGTAPDPLADGDD